MAKNLQIPQKQGKFKYKAQIIEKSHTEGLAKKEKRAKPEVTHNAGSII